MPFLEIEQRFGPRHLLRAGSAMVGTASILWLLAFAAAKILANGKADPLATILILTFTIVLWPIAILGILLLLGWFVLWIWSLSASQNTTSR